MQVILNYYQVKLIRLDVTNILFGGQDMTSPTMLGENY